MPLINLRNIYFLLYFFGNAGYQTQGSWNQKQVCYPLCYDAAPHPPSLVNWINQTGTIRKWEKMTHKSEETNISCRQTVVILRSRF